MKEMRFLREILLAPTIGASNAVDFESMDTDLFGMNRFEFQATRNTMEGWSKARVVWFKRRYIKLLFYMDQQIYRNITDEQISILLELMTCYLLQCKSFKENVSISHDLLDLMVSLNVFLLASNKKQQCEVWIREHFSELVSVRSGKGDSILHECMEQIQWILMKDLNLPMEPFVRLLVEEGKMDVNVVNTQRSETPLHLLSVITSYMDLNESILYPKMPTEDMMKIAEILINNGAHMDAVDASGREASWYFSQRFPRWSFNVSLKCLAAKALLKHGVRYEIRAHATVIPFIESHKPKESEDFSDDELP